MVNLERRISETLSLRNSLLLYPSLKFTTGILVSFPPLFFFMRLYRATSITMMFASLEESRVRPPGLRRGEELLLPLAVTNSFNFLRRRSTRSDVRVLNTCNSGFIDIIVVDCWMG